MAHVPKATQCKEHHANKLSDFPQMPLPLCHTAHLSHVRPLCKEGTVLNLGKGISLFSVDRLTSTYPH